MHALEVTRAIAVLITLCFLEGAAFLRTFGRRRAPDFHAETTREPPSVAGQILLTIGDRFALARLRSKRRGEADDGQGKRGRKRPANNLLT